MSWRAPLPRVLVCPFAHSSLGVPSASCSNYFGDRLKLSFHFFTTNQFWTLFVVLYTSLCGEQSQDPRFKSLRESCSGEREVVSLKGVNVNCG